MQHLSLRRGEVFVRRLKESGARYLLSTTWPRRKNKDIKRDGDPGYWNNLQAPPFSLPAPEECDRRRSDGDRTCLWDLHKV